MTGQGVGTQVVLLPCSKVLPPYRHHEQNQRSRAADPGRLPLGQISPPAVPHPAAGGAAAHDPGAREGHRGRPGRRPPQGTLSTRAPSIPHTPHKGRHRPPREGPPLPWDSGTSERQSVALGRGQGWDRNSRFLPLFCASARTPVIEESAAHTIRCRDGAGWPLLPPHSEPQVLRQLLSPICLPFLLHPPGGIRPPTCFRNSGLSLPPTLGPSQGTWVSTPGTSTAWPPTALSAWRLPSPRTPLCTP